MPKQIVETENKAISEVVSLSYEKQFSLAKLQSMCYRGMLFNISDAFKNLSNI